MRKELEDLKYKLSGRIVYLIGGGPSLNLLDFNLLKNKNIIVANSALYYFENALAVYWMDQNWASQNCEKLQSIKSYKFTSKINCENYIKNNIKAIGGGTVLRKVSDYGLSTDINSVCGNNTGAQMINLAVNAGVRKIVLLGYDMGIVEGKSHFHSHYSNAQPSVYTNLFIPCINSMAPLIQKMGIEVINCCMHSELKCFKKDNIENHI